ncbi:uroporphyrinogen-III synthase [Sulfurospirillum oryzae]|uniref:uroporphyrinogen-III synthase n=1 Tax=Sulfurospirillum oryzae TaxID=2976535 RepID=UPI0021E7F496|nr:uroporphyrinogen-III synthase [Sulfurospirillum oryzae]
MIYLFSDKAYEGVVHLPLFEIVFDPFKLDLEGFDAIIFTSKNSVKALEQSGTAWKDKEAYAIGEGTASFIERGGGNVVFTCKDSYGDVFAQALIPLLQNKKVFFPRAKEVVSSLFEILRTHHIDIEQRIVYETKCKHYSTCEAPPKDSKLIFTSPSTVHCFLENFAWDKSYRAIAIGEKTAAALPLHVKISVSKIQSIEACVSLAKAL